MVKMKMFIWDGSTWTVEKCVQIKVLGQIGIKFNLFDRLVKLLFCCTNAQICNYMKYKWFKVKLMFNKSLMHKHLLCGEPYNLLVNSTLFLIFFVLLFVSDQYLVLLNSSYRNWYWRQKRCIRAFFSDNIVTSVEVDGFKWEYRFSHFIYYVLCVYFDWKDYKRIRSQNKTWFSTSLTVRFGGFLDY